MFLPPMLLHKKDKPLTNTNYLTELKLDGIRLIYSNIETSKLYTRHNNEVTTKFPEIWGNEIPPGTILDGELIRTDPQGRPDFEAVMSRFMASDKRRIDRLTVAEPVTYCVFDILHYRGKNVCNLPLVKRKELLNKVIPIDTPSICKVQYINGNGQQYFDKVCQLGLEGIVQKDPNSSYQIGTRSNSWLKVINYSHTDVWITGIRKSEFGWLLAFPDGSPAGVLELGVPSEARKAVYLLSNEIKSKEKGDYIYFSKPLKCHVKYRCLTKSGMLRLPSFVKFIA